MTAHERRVSFILLLLAVLTGCSKEAPEKEPVVTVQTAVAKKTTVQQVFRTEAVLYPKNQAAITPKVSSPVRKFFVNRGARVKQGQLLAVLENRDLAAAVKDNQGALEQAQASYTNTTSATLPEEIKKAELDVSTAQQNLDANQKLYDSRESLFKEGALPRKDLDQAAVALVQARSQYQIAEQHLTSMRAVSKEQTVKSASGQLTSAQGKYQAASAQLSYTEIRSPISGVVTDRPVYPGETIAPSVALITIMDTSSVIAKAHIPEEEAALLKVGDSATIATAGSDPVNAKVVVVSPATDPNSTTVEVWIEAPNPDGAFRPGVTVQVSIIARTVQDAVVVPTAAILKTPEGGTTVMIVGSDGRAHQTQVETGIQSEDMTQVTKGMKPGDIVVANGAYGLPDKTKVKSESAASASDSKSTPAEKE